MLEKKKEHPKEKSKLHPRNKHRERYNFKQLIVSCPELAQFVKLNKYKDESIDFFDHRAVKMLNKALLKHFYKIENWDIPEYYLCPPIPGRADYIHHISDLLSSRNNNKIPIGKKIKCLDIGVGANCVYPIIGNREYGWSFVGSDIDKIAIDSANKIIESNPFLKGNIELRLQNNSKDIFFGVIKKGEQFDLTVCNPPFHASLAEVKSANLRKLSNLNQKKMTKTSLNFGGKNNELWCVGGEDKFVREMIRQSRRFSNSCFWFSTIISKQFKIKNIYSLLNKAEAVEVKTIPMGQGNKITRIIAWTFFSPVQQKRWIKLRWHENH
ncbi:MAG: 23S rRNA (adenine(1618)-N(6))-methyltransferase RlmF [Saprospiraceae bacterium]|nr:23S rRNA (adenine(1618)-N(6))-methyltransferase RlmF [Saprospiraceae bacterium]